MRTTLTLDDDVAARLEQLRDRDGRPFKQLVNDVLRRGLAAEEEPVAAGPFTMAVDAGRPLLADFDDVSEALALVEGQSHP